MPDSGPTMPQVCLRELFIGMTLAAPFYFMIGLLFRSGSFEEQDVVLRACVVASCGFFGTLAWLRYRRWKSECAAGACLWQAPRGPLWNNAEFYIGLFLLAMTITYQILFQFPSPFSPWRWLILLMGLQGGAISALPVSMLWSGPRICSSGIVESSRWIPWYVIEHYHWRRDGKKLLLVLQLHQLRLEVQFPAVKQQEKADVLLSEHIGQHESLAAH